MATHFEENHLEVTNKIKNNYKEILGDLGEDIDREGLLKTPERAAKAMKFLTQGYEQDATKILKSAKHGRQSTGRSTRG